jgi:Protein of unknown function (DUF1565)
MRKIFVLCTLVLAAAWARPALAACPGISACVVNRGCPVGSTQVRPGQSLQNAINAARTGATLCVLPGTYRGPINFAGKPIRLVSSGGPGVTFLDGGGTGRVVTFITAEGLDSVLDGFTIRNGRGPGGGGIYIRGASPTIRNNIVTNNRAIGQFGRGGGIAVQGPQASPAITCTGFLDNTASYSGGGLASSYSAAPYLRSNLFVRNRAPYGGAISVSWSGRLDLGWTELTANQAAVDGGGIHAGVPYGNVLVRQSWFRGNTAGSQGGGMWVPAGLAEVVNSTFDGNRAAEGGGIAAGHGSLVSVANTLFVRNTTTNPSSATLVNVHPSDSSVVNHFNGFFGNTPPDFANTYGDLGWVQLPSFGSSCCPDPGSPALDAGTPALHFNDADGSRNDIGACGGPTLLTYGHLL